MLGCQGEDASLFLATLKALLDDPAAVLTAPATELLARVDAKQATEIITKTVGKPPSRFDAAVPIVTAAFTGGLGGLTAAAGYNVKLFQHNRIIRACNAIFADMTMARPVNGLPDNHRTVLSAMANAYVTGAVPVEDWGAFFARFIWNGGACDLRPPASHAHHKYLALAIDGFNAVMKATQPEVNLHLQQAAARIARHSTPAVAAQLTAGAKWMAAGDWATSRVYTTDPAANGLFIGVTEGGADVRFAGNESLITIGGPGTGKSQAQVIPNLLTFPGSAFVLDVKDELWPATAAHRQRFGRVIRFAPTDLTGNTHAYNPFDNISREPNIAALQCQEMAYQLVPANPDLKDPFWENRGRDYLFSFALAMALKAPPDRRNLSTLAEFLSLPLLLNPKDPSYKTSATAITIANMKAIAAQTGISDLAATATSIESGILSQDTQRIDSVFDNARRHVTNYARAKHLRDATSRSDWNPLDLRTHQGTTVYFCLKPGEVEKYAPLVRILFQQHASVLTKDFTRRPRALPITFFLDEMPQLGHISSINDILDVGRGAGLRLWMFAQYIGQLKDVYKDKTSGLIGACQVRCFMQPDHDAATFISKPLGTTRSLFSGEKRPLAEPHELMGKAYADNIILLTRGDHPAVLAKRMAHASMGHLMRQRPPVVSRRVP